MFCTNCGKEIAEGSKFCKYCGEKVLYETDNKEKSEVRDIKPTSKGKNIVKIIGFVAVGLLFALASIFILSVINNQRHEANARVADVDNKSAQQSDVIQSDNSTESENATESENTSLQSKAEEEIDVQFSRDELDEIQRLVYLCYDMTSHGDENWVLDIEKLTQEERGYIVLGIANTFYRESSYVVGISADGNKYIFNGSFESEIRELLGIELRETEYEGVKYENGQYFINMGDGGSPCYQVGVGGYRVEGNQVIIDGYIELYEDEALLKLVELQKIEVIGERNEKSSMGHFKLKKIQIVEGGLTQ